MTYKPWPGTSIRQMGMPQNEALLRDKTDIANHGEQTTIELLGSAQDLQFSQGRELRRNSAPQFIVIQLPDDKQR